MTKPLFSVIIPAYKIEDFLDRAVRSLEKQSCDDWEAIIISDDKVDYQTVLAGKGVSNPKLKFTSTCKIASGAGNARNAGLEVASGAYIATLDADDEFTSNRLEDALPLLQEYSAVVTSVRSDREVKRPDNFRIEEIITPSDVLYLDVPANSLVLRKSVLKHRWPVLSCMEDALFLLKMYDDFDIHYMDTKSYLYHYNLHSLCNSKNAGVIFPKTRKMLLKEIDREDFYISNPSIKGILKRYLLHKDSMEKLYLAKKKAREVSDFWDFTNKFHDVYYINPKDSGDKAQ